MAKLEAPAAGGDRPAAVGYALSLALVVGAALLAFVVKHLVAAPSLTLIFVLPVVVAAAAFGWGPALTAAICGVLTFDFFFTQPYHSLWIASPADLWAAGLLLVIAAIVSSVAAESRRRALDAREAAEQAQALQGLAHLVIEAHPEWQVMRAATEALSRTLRAPSVILLQNGASLAPVASAGQPRLTEADREAARAALELRMPIHAGVYPYGSSEFDFWPAAAQGGAGWVIGVGRDQAGGGGARRERPVLAERFVDVVRGYVAAAVASGAREASPREANHG